MEQQNYINFLEREVEKTLLRQKDLCVYINQFSNYPISESLKQKFYIVSNTMFNKKIKLGDYYEAEKFLQILSNEKLVGDFAHADQSKRVKMVLDCLAQRAVSEEKDCYRDTAKQFIADVHFKRYGNVDMTDVQMEDYLKESVYKQNKLKHKILTK